MSVSAVTRSLRALRASPIKSLRPFSTSPNVSSGHNKWSKIKGTKGAMDTQKSELYSKFYKDIMVAVRENGPDPVANASLAAAMKRAKNAGVPKDNIENAYKKALGGKDKGDQAVTYEAIGPGSVGIVIECLTSNTNRAHKFTRETLIRHDARLAPVAFLFKRRGVVIVSIEQGDDFDARIERLIEAALEAEAEDFEQNEPEDGVVEVEFTCEPSNVTKLTNAVMAPGLCKELVSSEIAYLPVEKAEPVDEDTETKIGNLVRALEGLEDVVRVATTLD